ncbi:MAG: 3-hydroxyacyl-CoA dehydrogenase [Rubrivivax sp.]|nr:3-hydroxyacyl-CoA dehydrogenase [Rubrivivax sp.]
MDLRNTPVLVVGAGIMGAGIAQVAAQAGHAVKLYDTRAGAAAEAKAKLAATLEGLVAKGRLEAAAAAAAVARIVPVSALGEAADAQLVVEAVVEKLDVKRGLFRELEGIVAPSCVLATNTSSISVTAIANGLAHPGRLAGMHFFNPVPLMKLVEVVSGLQTDAGVAAAIFELAKAWGKVPVHAKSTPGFIVNRIARPYYAEALALLLERAAEPAALDACLKAAGFRMGPCELMDLIGHDTNFAVTQSVYEANFFDKRYQPSLVQREMVDGGLLGRKSGRGFYRYGGGAGGGGAGDGAAGAPAADTAAPAAPPGAHEVTVHGDGPIAELLEAAATQALAGHGWGPARDRGSAWTGLRIDGARLMLSDGRTAQQVAAAMAVADVALFDRPLVLPPPPGTALAFAVAPQAGDAWRAQVPGWLAALGFTPVPLADSPGLVVTRTVAMLVNEAADAVLQGVCTPAGADAAMKLGVAYPAGPFEWLARWSPGGAAAGGGAAAVIGVLEALDAHYRGERYRVSPWLRRQQAAAQ